MPDRYNIAVRQPAAVLFAADGRWQLAPMAWGLVPSWEREPATKYSTQTARLDRGERRVGERADLLRRHFPGAEVRDLSLILDGLRSIKSPREIALVREATRISGEGLIEAMRSAQPGMYEYEIGAIADTPFPWQALPLTPEPLHRAQLSVIRPGYPQPSAEETAAAFRDGWFVSGDAGVLLGRRVLRLLGGRWRLSSATEPFGSPREPPRSPWCSGRPGTAAATSPSPSTRAAARASSTSSR